MPPKKAGKGKASASGGGAVEGEREEPFQAVVFTDSYETRFAPFTLRTPRCLLPLANVPLIEYTLEFLAGLGVEEVFVYCGEMVDRVEEYLKKSKWMASTSPFSLEVIRSPSQSVGDAMRDLDQKQLILGDFICVYGDVVANVSLEGALAAHRARREKDKKAIMTMVLRNLGSGHRTLAQVVKPVFLIDPIRQRCVYYEEMRPGDQHGRLEIPEDALAQSDEFELCSGLLDCGIDICTPEVLAQYTDNFDWQLPRRGFLRGILKDYETNQLTIHTHVLTKGYAARARNLLAYDAVSKDVISRWAYPYCPDTNFPNDHTYQFQRGNIYKEEGVFLARSCTINSKSVLGKASSVGDDSIISGSVIGRRCMIGKRVRITDAYIWDDARIGDDAVIENAIVANEASIGRKCHVHSGALIAHGVNIADGTTVARKRVTKLERKIGYDADEIIAGRTDPKVVGQGGDGFEMVVDEDEDPFVETLISCQPSEPEDLNNLSDASVSAFGSDEEASDDEVDDLSGHARSLRSGSFASITSEDGLGARRAAADFHHEATHSIVDALQNEEDVDNIQLELQALKLSSNAEDKQVRKAVAVALARRMSALVEGGQSPKDAVAASLGPNKLLVQRCVLSGSGVYDEQAEFLLFLQSEFVCKPNGGKILFAASTALATYDLVEAEGVEMWWEDGRSSATDEMVAVRRETKQLVDVLVGDEESEEEDSDDDDDDDE